MSLFKQKPQIASRHKKKSYEDYIQDARAHIQATRPDLEDDNAAHIIDVNSPYEYQPPPNTPHAHQGILLVHGLLESPYSLHCIFEHYRRQGYWVRSLLLPGHGTQPEDLLHTHWNDWLGVVQDGITHFSKHVQEINVIGFSTGASLALLLNLMGSPIDRIVAFAPAIYLHNPLVHVAQYFAFFSPMVHSPPRNRLCKISITPFPRYR